DAISGDYAEYGADEMDVYVTYSAEDRHFTSYPLIDLSDFDMTECGTLLIYVRQGSGIRLPDADIKPLKIHF
nr:hypothetical protein [Lachnospiraceae bacterium]